VLVTLDPASAAQEYRLGLRILAGLAVLLGLGLCGLAGVYRRRGRRRDVPVLLIGGAVALAGGAYLLWALP
jgi:hypothetical protein